MGKIIDSVCALAVQIANDDSHGYSQYNRDGNPDFDCSSLMNYLWTACGVDVKSRGATYTGNMLMAYLQAGFRKVNPALESLQAGDVLLNVKQHTALYIGNGKMVHAAIAENGTIHGQPGDQTGKEICVTTYYDFPWDYVLRYVESDTSNAETPPQSPVLSVGANYNDENHCFCNLPMIESGLYGPAVAAAQAALNYHGFGKLELDGDFGPETEKATRAFQKVHKLEIDGVIGPYTWNELMYWR